MHVGCIAQERIIAEQPPTKFHHATLVACNVTSGKGTQQGEGGSSSGVNWEGRGEAMMAMTRDMQTLLCMYAGRGHRWQIRGNVRHSLLCAP